MEEPMGIPRVAVAEAPSRDPSAHQIGSDIRIVNHQAFSWRLHNVSFSFISHFYDAHLLERDQL
jgi:hypothetical protein